MCMNFCGSYNNVSSAGDNHRKLSVIINKIILNNFFIIITKRILRIIRIKRNRKRENRERERGKKMNIIKMNKIIILLMQK